MSSTDLIRWSGLAALIGGVLFILADVLNFAFFPGEESAQMMAASSWFIIQIVSLLGLLLITIGLTGMYAHQAQEAGTLGLISFVVAFSGMMRNAAHRCLVRGAFSPGREDEIQCF